MSLGARSDDARAFSRDSVTARGRRPRIAIVALAIHEFGGNDQTLIELITRNRDEFDFAVVAAHVPPSLEPYVDWQRIRVPERLASLRLLLFFFLGGLRLARRNFDLVHTQGAIVPNRASLATVHFCHAGFLQKTGRLSPPGSPLLRRVNHGVFRLLCMAAERWCYRTNRVKLIAAVSASVANEMERHYPGIPLVLTPNGVDTERFRPNSEARKELREREGVEDDEVIALFVGGDWDTKGLTLVIEGIAVAKTATERLIRLWVVGEGPESRFRPIAGRLGLAENVRFFGPRPDPERYYQAADVFVLPSLYETFSLVAYEAAASGLPVIATAVGGIEDLLGEEEAGLIVPRSKNEVGWALSRLAEDSGLRRLMGEAGRARVAEFNWSRSVQRVVAAYEQILRGSQAEAVA